MMNYLRYYFFVFLFFSVNTVVGMTGNIIAADALHRAMRREKRASSQPVASIEMLEMISQRRRSMHADSYTHDLSAYPGTEREIRDECLVMECLGVSAGEERLKLLKKQSESDRETPESGS